jgi:polysaccharide pyruvyl transferase WcaK-like protein
MTPGEFKKWLSAHGDVYFSVCSWMEHYRRVDAVIGPRIHGVMLALQVGTPSVCIVHDSRTQELCELMKVPHILAKDIIGGISREQVEAAVKEFNIDEFFDNRRALAKRYIDFLKWNNLEPSHHLEKQALP